MRGTVVVSLLLACAVVARAADERGWTGGEVAAGTARVTAPPEPVDRAVPPALAAKVRGPTVLFYFSPKCPHCRRVAREIRGLHERLAAHGASVLGVATGGSRKADIAEFVGTFGIPFPVVEDTDRAVQQAFGFRSTPSAVLVDRKGRTEVTVRDLWFPYQPGLDAIIEGRVAGDPFARLAGAEPDSQYLGHYACGACHTQEHASWRLTHHSIAWRTLERARKTEDGACTGCHVTGRGHPDGWSGESHGALVDVGCEACHGPAGPHDGARAEARASCAGCHDEKHSIAFSYEKGLPLLDHYLIASLSAEEARKREQALWRGEAPRELLAFPVGKNVGPAACRSCHPEQHDWWATDAHARAMDALRPKDADDPACVRCHATPERSDPASPPTALSDFAILDGVSCESCHGPGEAHVQAEGGSSNIEGLGDDCPVCVIEAVCTGCHTPEWDPDWNLDRRLKQIGH